MNIALVGATGNIGSRILDEALSRGHHVTGITRDPKKLSGRDGLQVRKGSTTALAGFVRVLQGHEAAIISVKWNENDIKRVLEALRHSGVKRCLFVVGAGSLLRKDGRTHLDYMAEKGVQPPTSKPASLALAEIQKVTDLDWTAISPSASTQPPQRTAQFPLRNTNLIHTHQTPRL